MNVEKTLRMLALFFNSYSILAATYLLFLKTLENHPMKPLEFSTLVTIAIALLFGMFADIVSR